MRLPDDSGDKAAPRNLLRSAFSGRSFPALAIAACFTIFYLKIALQSAIEPLFYSNRASTFNSQGLTHDVTKCKGYRLARAWQASDGIIGQLSLIAPCRAFGEDVGNLVLSVRYESKSRLRVHTYDAGERHYQLSKELWPRAELVEGDWKTDGDLEFHFNREPFEYWITRKSDGDVIFDTRQSSIPVHGDVIPGKDDSLKYRNNTAMPAYPLIFEDRYLQIASALPDNANIYGLGEVSSSSGFRRDEQRTVATMWAADRGVPVDTNFYGSFPFYLEHRIRNGNANSHGVFLLSSQGMDIILRPGVVEYRVLGGTLDFTFYSGPSPKSVIEQHGANVGLPLFPPLYALGFNLCKWGWDSVEAVEDIISKMRAANIPLETVWSDIDHMDQYRDFTLGPKFPVGKMRAMIDNLHSNHQSFVPIVDAAISTAKDYDVFTSGLKKDVFVKTSDGKTNYYGQVWPGETAFPDFLAPNTQAWWRQAFRNFSKLVDFDGIWLDMNEAADQGERKPGGDGPLPAYGIHNAQDPVELGARTLSLNATHHCGLKELDVHNIYGYSEEVATYHALREIQPNRRPYVISRSTFSKSGQYTGHWTGDNKASWLDMKQSIQGVLQFQLFQIPLVGADVCGFGDNTSEELCNRWMSLGAFTPWYRNHNAIENRGQEPFRWESVATASRTAIAIRYSLLPYFYTLFAQAHDHGSPVVGALFFEFPEDPSLVDVSTQFLVGSSILVTPVLEKGATRVDGLFPDHRNTIWRDWYTHQKVLPKEGKLRLDAPLSHIPLHIRGGFATLLFAKPAYTVFETQQGGYTLLAALDATGSATGRAYLDDGISPLPTDNRWLQLSATRKSLQISTLSGTFQSGQSLYSVTVLGVKERPINVLGDSQNFRFTYEPELERLNISDFKLSLDSQNIVFKWA